MQATDITIDLSETQRACDAVRDTLLELAARHDLRRYQYTTRIRIAPGEISHSHPHLTVNTRVRVPEPLLCLYLHEQMHWYVTWYSWARKDGWQAIWKALEERYPDIPTAFPAGAHTRSSSYLHLIVNWLEIQAAAYFLGKAKAIEIATVNFVYSGLYKIVLADWDALAELYEQNGLVPIRAASDMNQEDLDFAARMDEATVDHV
jgi:hypothetical protein